MHQIVYLKDIINNLAECSYYSLEISLFPGNPPFNAILYTGFKSGGYRQLYTTGTATTDPSFYPNALIRHWNKIKFFDRKEDIGWPIGFQDTRKFNKYGKLRKDWQHHRLIFSEVGHLQCNRCNTTSEAVLLNQPCSAV